jgi:hypothetical protein
MTCARVLACCGRAIVSSASVREHVDLFVGERITGPYLRQTGPRKPAKAHPSAAPSPRISAGGESAAAATLCKAGIAAAGSRPSGIGTDRAHRWLAAAQVAAVGVPVPPRPVHRRRRGLGLLPRRRRGCALDVRMMGCRCRNVRHSERRYAPISDVRPASNYRSLFKRFTLAQRILWRDRHTVTARNSLPISKDSA